MTTRVILCLPFVGVLFFVDFANARTNGNEVRLAVVIGNDYKGYEHRDLDNAYNDAVRIQTLVTKTIPDQFDGKYGFTLIDHRGNPYIMKNATHAQIVGALDNLASRIAYYRGLGKEVFAVFYFSGHGRYSPGQLKDRDLLIPVDGQLSLEKDSRIARMKEKNLVDCTVVLEKMSGATRGAAFFDSCRSARGRVERTRTNNDKKISGVMLSNFVVCHAASPGGVAHDGDKRSGSPLTNALVNWLDTKSIPVSLACEFAATEVQTTTLRDSHYMERGGVQVPEVSYVGLSPKFIPVPKSKEKRPAEFWVKTLEPLSKLVKTATVNGHYAIERDGHRIALRSWLLSKAWHCNLLTDEKNENGDYVYTIDKKSLLENEHRTAADELLKSLELAPTKNTILGSISPNLAD